MICTCLKCQEKTLELSINILKKMKDRKLKQVLSWVYISSSGDCIRKGWMSMNMVYVFMYWNSRMKPAEIVLRMTEGWILLRNIVNTYVYIKMFLPVQVLYAN
jgi:maltose-binding protein MalE